MEQGLRRTESTVLCVKNQKGKNPFFDRRLLFGLLQVTPRKYQFRKPAEVGSVTPHGHWPRSSAGNTGPASGLWEGNPC